MEKPIENFWSLRLADVVGELEENNFEVHVAEDKAAARKIVMEILSKIDPKSISWGGSMTFVQTGLYQELKEYQGAQILDTFQKGAMSPEEMFELRRRALTADLFITGSNAVTETGKLVNLDMTGNRVAAITFGPRNVIILAGRNKVVPDVEDAMLRVKNYAAPANAMRLDKKTPCAKTSICEECRSPDRICNTWTITEKSFPKGRIKIVLINEDLGL
ncbi:putative Lactate utilization protein B/C [Syntrophobacter sp. SbD1]|nr:putative Lactate utilization protein B/C [Syntrophobacter sp. SbD1]